MSEPLMCRTCLSNDVPLISVFEIRKINGEIISISSMLNFFTNIEISIDDVLPTSICKLCLTEIQQAFIFRQKCIKSNKFLEEKYMKPPNYNHERGGGGAAAAIGPGHHSIFGTNFNLANPASNLLKLSSVRTMANNSNTSNILEPHGSPEFIDISSLNKQINLALSNSSINHLRLDGHYENRAEMMPNNRHHHLHHHHQTQMEMMSDDKYVSELNISANLKPMACDICGKLFYNYFSLKKHIKLHTGERRYKCNLCPKAFFQSSCLKRHIDTHSSVKKFPCQVCGVGLSRKDHLRRHMERLHSIHRIFKCSICGKCYSTVLDLRRHTDTHTYGKRFTCPICGIGISRKDHLKRHINNKHKAEAEKLSDLNQYAHPVLSNVGSELFTHQPLDIQKNPIIKQEPHQPDYDKDDDSDIQIYPDIVKMEPRDLTDSPEIKSFTDDDLDKDDDEDDNDSRLSSYSYTKEEEEEDLKNFSTNPYYNFVLNENPFFRKDLTIK